MALEVTQPRSYYGRRDALLRVQDKRKRVLLVRAFIAEGVAPMKRERGVYQQENRTASISSRVHGSLICLPRLLSKCVVSGEA